MDRANLAENERLASVARRHDAWAATRGAILEVDEANLNFPQYFERASGPWVWDVDENRYLDFVLGYGPVILGHAHPEVQEAVASQLALGTCASPLWHPRQVELTALLTEIIPSAEMAYLMRTGSDATTAAVRLARIFTGRPKVVRWGYNGWHDWCAPRLEGVPASTQSETLTFRYNDLDSLRAVLQANPGQVAAVIMMSYEYDAPADGFLNGVKALAHEHGALFVLDEMRSGFRIALGGAQAVYGVEPDLSTFSKAMSNGYPISAVTGRADVLMCLGETHMSSTYYGNPAEMAAAIATIGILRDTDALDRVGRLSARFTEGLRRVVAGTGLPADVIGLPISPFLAFRQDAADARVRFYAEVIRGGILLHPNHQWFLSAAHTDDQVDEALEVCEAAARRAVAAEAVSL